VTARLLLVVAAVVVCGLVTAGAFWALDALLGESMPHPAWGFAGGVAVALLSYARTGWSDRRDGRRSR
jgi:peptidoglycan/LPS O-acetylase OafA/YrhL